jgi:hypothetical protein
MKSVSRVATTAAPVGGIELSELKLAELIAAIEAASAAGDQRRLAARLPAHGTVMLASVSPLEPHPPRQVRVYDISRCGIAVIDSEAAPAGRQFNLLVPRQGRRPLEMLCTVRHTRPLGDAHLIGAQYGASWLSTIATLVHPDATGRVTS